MIRRLLDRIAARLGYVRTPITIDLSTKDLAALHLHEDSYTVLLGHGRTLGLPSAWAVRIEIDRRGEKRASRLARDLIEQATTTSGELVVQADKQRDRERTQSRSMWKGHKWS